MTKSEFQLQDFLPYLLNRAAEKSSLEFQQVYKSRYGMLRIEWRFLFHLGAYGEMTARDLCVKAGLHKTKVSRAVTALEEKRFLTRSENPEDRRFEFLKLTKHGHKAYEDLHLKAKEFQAEISRNMTKGELETLTHSLQKLIAD